MNPVAGGGVVAWTPHFVNTTDGPIAFYGMQPDPDGHWVEKSDLEACQQRCAELEAMLAVAGRSMDHKDTLITAAQAEADRVRVAGRKVVLWYAATHAEDDGFVPSVEIRELIAAIHAAKTEQERGE